MAMGSIGRDDTRTCSIVCEGRGAILDSLSLKDRARGMCATREIHLMPRLGSSFGGADETSPPALSAALLAGVHSPRIAGNRVQSDVSVEHRPRAVRAGGGPALTRAHGSRFEFGYHCCVSSDRRG